ncbi:MAG: hypothetical protein C0613_07510 [Desulfobulbaceae bacterium]|nr:MAG: hypothetical protein C0613_07510 [Desulfobulbaceae bacterium]
MVGEYQAHAASSSANPFCREIPVMSMPFFRLFVGSLLVSFVVCPLLVGCTAGRATMTGRALHDALDAGTQLRIVDVRSRAEFGRGHIPGAIHIPFWQMGRRSKELGEDKDVPVVLYCAHGPRAWWAAFVLRRQGFSRVSLLAGSFKAWQQSGLAVASGNE